MTSQIQSTNPREAMLRDRLWFATVALLILLPCLGLWGANAYVSASSSCERARWRQLKPLPARGVDIVGADYSIVYVRMDTGNYYACRHPTNLGPDSKCWYPVQTVPIDARRPPSDHIFSDRELAPTPTGTVVDTFDVSLAAGEVWQHTHYLLVEDEGVFVWQCRGSIGSWLTQAFGFFVGLALASAAVAVLWRRAKRST